MHYDQRMPVISVLMPEVELTASVKMVMEAIYAIDALLVLRELIIISLLTRASHAFQNQQIF
jgi:hypothetical protein